MSSGWDIGDTALLRLHLSQRPSSSRAPPGAVTSLSNVHYKIRGRERREAGRFFKKTFLSLVFISVRSAADTAFLVQKGLVIHPEQAVRSCPHTLYLCISALRCSVFFTTHQVNLRVSFIAYVWICLLYFLPGRVTCVQHQAVRKGHAHGLRRGKQVVTLPGRACHCVCHYLLR